MALVRAKAMLGGTPRRWQGWLASGVPARLLGTLALGVALGSLVVGHMLLVPMLAGDTSLIDPNLARALAEPLALRCGELLLGACVIVAAVGRRWTDHRIATSLGLIAATLAAGDRVVLLPRLQKAWSRVDLVARRPVERLADAEQLQQIHEVVLALALIVLVALALVSALGRASGARSGDGERAAPV